MEKQITQKVFILFLLLSLGFMAKVVAQKPTLLKVGVADSALLDYKTIGDTSYFKVKQGAYFQLWKTDGTPGGTKLVKDSFVSEIGNFAAINNTLYFFGPNRAGKPALYKSNGTPAGTQIVRSFATDSAVLLGLSVINNVGYFSYTHGTPHYEGVWKTYGDSAGTTEIKSGLIVKKTFENKAFFKAGLTAIIFVVNYPNNTYSALWKTDGTLAGTTKLKDSVFNYSTSKIGGMVQTSTCAIFTNTFGASNLWRSDGSIAGTYLIRGGSINNLTLYNDKAYFLSGAVYKTLNQTDGSAFGAVLGLTNVGNSLGVLGNKLFLGGKDNNDWEPYAGDATPSNSVLLKDIHLGTDAGGSDPRFFTAVNGTMFFVANDYLHSDQIYKTNGTPSGTSLAYSLADTIRNFSTKGLSASGTNLLFVSGNNLYSLRTTGVSGLFPLNQEQVLNLYPNPTNGILNIDYKASSEATLKVYSCLGQEVLSIPFASTIDLAGLGSGIYLLSILDGEKSITRKVILE
ncbi:MAG: hypothetical protein CFE21_08075 [Bacteroidetes bacterium B1(2017)]|nr:MAG: hypothetical protein CFE21_08075 [Bacteroidetes bacterium B1(2017)]